VSTREMSALGVTATAQSPQVRIERRGDGDPALVFVHGASCDLHDWDNQTAALSDRFRTLALDLPGHGLTPATPDLGVGALGSMVAAIAREEARPCILIGHSAGCRVILEAALQSDDTVGLVFVDGSLLIGPDAESAEASLLAKLDGLGFEGYMDAMFGSMFVAGCDPNAQAAIIRRARSWDPAAARPFLTSTVRWDLLHARAALSRLRVPCLAIQSTYLDHHLERRSLEPGVITPWMEALADLTPQTRVEIVTGAGHFVQIDRADLVNRLIADFAKAALVPGLNPGR